MKNFDNTDAEINRVTTALKNGMATGMYILEADTKQVCPVDTGTLKRSYTSGVDVDGATVTGWCGSNVEYAVWADMKRPHLSLKAKEDQTKIKNAIVEAVING